MRTAISGLAAVLILLSTGNGAQARCANSALGTERTIRLDPALFQRVNGGEKRLGLKNREVVLTFDDGPIAGKTDRILDILARDCVKATFFAVGQMARAYPALARRIVREGHTLAHHTHQHDRLTGFSPVRAAQRIERGIESVEEAAYGSFSGNVRTPLFRYPYLASNRATDALLRERGLIAVGANIDARDWERISPETVLANIKRQLASEGRGIILMHDIQARTAVMLPRLLDWLRAEGYRVVHLAPPGDPDIRIASLPRADRAGTAELVAAGLVNASLSGSYALPDETAETASVQEVEQDLANTDRMTVQSIAGNEDGLPGGNRESLERWKVRNAFALRSAFIILPAPSPVENAPAAVHAGAKAERNSATQAGDGNGMAPAIRAWALRAQLAQL